MAYRLMIVDDHPVVLMGLKLLFAGDARFELCGEAISAPDACLQAESRQPDLIVTDLVMGGADGVALISDLLSIVPASRILVYSSHDELMWARHILRAGALGYVSKSEPLETVALALEKLIRGEISVSASVQRLLDSDFIYSARRSDHDQKRLIQAQNDQLDQLMAITAHDLRSPLFGLRNLFNLALRRANAEPELPLRVMRDGIASLDSMLALVTRLLDAHRAEHAPLADQVHDDLRAHLIAAERRLAPLTEAAAVTVDMQLPESPLCARFDAGALAQILDNLLGNAVRYSPAGQPLHLSAFASQDRAVIAIEDCGPGIDSAAQATMFDKFRRSSGAVPSVKAGAGMGLYIAAISAARIGASLVYRPATPTGSIFEISLPITQR